MGSKNMKMPKWLVVTLVLFVVAVGVGYFTQGFKNNPLTGQAFAVSTVPNSNGQQSGTTTVGAIVSGTPSLTTVNFFDNQARNTILLGTKYYSLNGQSPSTTIPALSIGSTLQVLVYNGTSILAGAPIGTVTQTYTVDSSFIGGKTLNLYADSYTAPSLTFYQAFATLANKTTFAGSSGINGTKSASGGSIKPVNIQLQEANLKSTGDAVWVIEFGSSANVSASGVTLADASGNLYPVDSVIPTAYSRKYTNGLVMAFDVPAFKTTATYNLFLNAQANSGKVIQNLVYTSIYGKQAFLDSDGTFNPSGLQDKLFATKTTGLKTFAIALS